MQVRARPTAADERTASDVLALELQFDDFRPELLAGHADSRDRYGQPEPTRTGATRIKKQHTRARVDQGLMRVSIDHSGVANGRGVEVEFRNVMQHVEH